MIKQASGGKDSFFVCLSVGAPVPESQPPLPLPQPHAYLLNRQPGRYPGHAHGTCCCNKYAQQCRNRHFYSLD